MTDDAKPTRRPQEATAIDADAVCVDTAGWRILEDLRDDLGIAAGSHPGVLRFLEDLRAIEVDYARLTDYGVRLLQHKREVTAVDGACPQCGCTRFVKSRLYTTDEAQCCANCRLAAGSQDIDTSAPLAHLGWRPSLRAARLRKGAT